MTTINSMSNLGLYIHIPFCVRKCRYCGFLSFETGNHEDYVKRLVRELENYKNQYKTYTVDTVFMGGGTPSILSSEQLKSIIDAVHSNFKLSSDAEFTIEANPGTVSLSKLKALRGAGVNRLSLGVQSFDDKVLKALGRIHTADEARESFALARQAGFENINIDLMFGVPELTFESWMDTASEAVRLDPEHISAYSLQLEEGTPFYEMYKKGEIEIAGDELDRKMYHEALAAFRDAGYEHYEISNLAKPGFECRHNLKYWSYEEYLGAGLGAHSYIRTAVCSDGCTDGRGSRFNNYEDMEYYNAFVDDGQWPIDMGRYHTDSLKDGMAVYAFTALRKREGIDLSDFEAQFGMEFFKAYRAKADVIFDYKSQGLLDYDAARLWLTEKGIDKSNEIMSEFV